ncbi:D-alanyl-D-alanine carboxypeptidase [Streptomyces sp. KAU_LT]|uniref:D-alanyl-D-alanine carboxypeptidase n=1 Tax=Streptomyces sp. KAU_LT TaxID=3046669 RepID=UPI0024B698C0|nr:D-alanyl-D-alanine carboxypeptidase [Streptomyces sp. KAU_LT]MDI9836028.1 D-alanyl-D-alanine carboxypeptidase [Streptomyces sp. KAU_LT]
MAGESPDRSKQRESSAEPTSGSAVPVPESRPEPEAGTRPAQGAGGDPRLAMARESSSRGGVDTATRVLSREDLDEAREEPAEASEETEADGDESAESSEGAASDREDAEDAPADNDDTAEAAGDSGDSNDPEDSADEAPGKGEDRLRNAVAAWVASSDAKDASDDATSEASAKDTADEAAGADAKADSDSDSDTGSDSASETDSASDSETDADDTPAKSTGVDQATAIFRTRPAEPEKAPKASKADDSTKADADDEPAGKETPDDGKGVDQATAVFRTRPAKPHVDQPTTMLKAPKPDAPEPEASKPEGSKPGPSKPEAPDAEAPKAERTSRFVALKPDLPPAAPKAPEAPRPPADVTAAVPQIGPERTTQQPLPPKPPLDLLAELTNTPPPPETPVRTLVRRVKIWTPLVILLAIVFAIVQSVRPLPAPTLDLTAQDSFTFEGDKVDIPWPAQGQAALDVDGIGSFGSSGDQKPVPIASVAKVMTAYLILREHPLKSGAQGPKIKIDQAAEDQSKAGQESTVDVTKGDSITQREALESILIASANNVARLLARWDAGSEKDFVAKMNATAEKLGMTNTTYTDPSGLNNTTVSTAVDQVKLAKAAMKEPAFREVAAMMSYDDYKGVNHPNWNQLVGRNDVVGIKTGTTTSALGNLVFAAKKEVGGETRTIIGAVVRQPAGGPENTILSAALYGGDQLIRAAQGALEPATILKKGDVVGYVDDGLGGRTPVVATKDVTAVGWAGLKVKLTFASDEVPHTAKAGTEVGTLTVGDGSSGAVKIPVALKTDLTEPGFTDKLTRIG